MRDTLQLLSCQGILKKKNFENFEKIKKFLFNFLTKINILNKML
jgi:hypothetical protein